MTDIALPDPQSAMPTLLRERCRAIFDARADVVGRLPLEAADELRRKDGIYRRC